MCVCVRAREREREREREGGGGEGGERESEREREREREREHLHCLVTNLKYIKPFVGQYRRVSSENTTETTPQQCKTLQQEQQH